MQFCPSGVSAFGLKTLSTLESYKISSGLFALATPFKKEQTHGTVYAKHYSMKTKLKYFVHKRAKENKRMYS